MDRCAVFVTLRWLETLLDRPLQYLAQLPTESASLVEGQEMGAASGLILDESIIDEGHR